MADELISRKAAIEWFTHKENEFCEKFRPSIRLSFANSIARALNKLPAVDAVEVVRCGECVNGREMDKYEKLLYPEGCIGCAKLSTSYHFIIMMPDSFCSYGERREESSGK